jgi:sirohydrochlorin ferrochelatase
MPVDAGGTGPARIPPEARLVLVAHGSRDPGAERSTWALARAVRRRAAGRVDAAFLDFSAPRLVDALAEPAGTPAVVVPLLLTAAYHGRVDVPAEVARAASAGVDVRLAEVLGPVGGAVPDRVPLELIVTALVRRLTEAGSASSTVDGVVLAAAGSREPVAWETVGLVADALSAALGLPCRPGYASGTGPGTDAAVRALAAGGARRIAVASYFLAPGLLHDRAVERALAAGAAIAAEPLGDAPEIVDLVLARSAASRSDTLALAA